MSETPLFYFPEKSPGEVQIVRRVPMIGETPEYLHKFKLSPEDAQALRDALKSKRFKVA